VIHIAYSWWMIAFSKSVSLEAERRSGRKLDRRFADIAAVQIG